MSRTDLACISQPAPPFPDPTALPHTATLPNHTQRLASRHSPYSGTPLALHNPESHLSSRWRILQKTSIEDVIMAGRRTQQEINDIGFGALVNALGREDAMLFIRQFRIPAAPGVEASDDPGHLPPMSVEEAHEKIRDMQEPQDQVSLL